MAVIHHSAFPPVVSFAEKLRGNVYAISKRLQFKGVVTKHHWPECSLASSCDKT